MAPPANDNRGQGISLGRLSFTGLRLVLVLGIVTILAAIAAATGLV
jgi:type II secretory pathway pseudopilin PulG